MADFDYIDRPSALQALAKDLRREKIVAFDTEADSFYHYFEKLCLLQVATRHRIYLIDPLALPGPEALAPIAAVMRARSPRKVFHAADYDLFVLQRDLRARVRHLFDTMVSAQLLGYRSVGLSALVAHHFGVFLPKDEQRSDWSQRPLRESQLRYAASDVAYLIPLAERLEEELRRARRLEWAREEFAALEAREWPKREFDARGYLRIKGARSLDPVALAVLRELYRMRDARAREADRPPFKVLGNRALVEIAQRRPRTAAELGRIQGVTDLVLRRLGRDVLRAVERGSKAPHGPLPKREGRGHRIDRRAERLLARLKRWRSRRARELGLDPGVLCPNATLELIALRRPKGAAELASIEGVKRWFAKEFGDEVARVVADEAGSGGS